MTRLLLKRIGTFLLSICIIAAMIALSQTEAKAEQSNKISEEELKASYSRNDNMADIIMTADDFLKEGEKSADYEDIHDYLDSIDKNGISGKSYVSIRETNEDIEVTEVVSDEDAVDETEDELDSVPTDDVLSDDIDTEDTENAIKVDKNDWRLILVNKQNPVPTDYDAELTNINSSLMADARIIDDIYEMLDAAQEDGVSLMICSAYRSYDRQTTLFNNKMNKLMNQGMNYMDAYAVGSMSVTVPGTSEHQLGLALDILTPGYVEMDDGFGETEAGLWLAQNAPDYGFILRYPKDKEEITGIIYEPWHFRYVGIDYSKDITELGVCLEEYLKGEY